MSVSLLVEDLVNGNRTVGKIRFVERAGPRIRDLVCQKTPWRAEKCTRDGCKPCEGKPGSCRQRNLTYQITCMTCKADGKESQYFGESSRTWWDRASEHVSALRTKNEKFAIVKHWLDEHRDQDSPPEYQFKALGSHKTAIERQIKEALLIQNNREKVNILNSKAEWGLNRLPRMKITVEDEVFEEKIHIQAPIPQHKRKNPLFDTQQELQGDAMFSQQYTQRKRAKRMNRNANASTELTGDPIHPTQEDRSTSIRQSDNSFKDRFKEKQGLLKCTEMADTNT